MRDWESISDRSKFSDDLQSSSHSGVGGDNNEAGLEMRERDSARLKPPIIKVTDERREFEFEI